MIKLETLSGQPYDTVYLNETDFKYRDVRNHIMKNIKRPYPEYNPSKFKFYEMYVKTDIKLFNKGKLINFDDDIYFDKEYCVLQICIKYEYLLMDQLYQIHGGFLKLLRDDEQTEEICKLAVHRVCKKSN